MFYIFARVKFLLRWDYVESWDTWAQGPNSSRGICTNVIACQSGGGEALEFASRRGGGGGKRGRKTSAQYIHEETATQRMIFSIVDHGHIVAYNSKCIVSVKQCWPLIHQMLITQSVFSRTAVEEI